jgi:FAD dependent oxidoreductase
MLYDYCVIGNGLIGSSVALELALKSKKVCVLGAAYGDEGKYYSSHEDDSRIARCWHTDHYWEALARRNLEKIGALSRTTGINILRRTPVFYRCDSGFVPATCSARPTDAEQSCNFAIKFNFEDVYGGIIEPKLYIAALNQEARTLGADIFHAVVHEIRWKEGRSAVQTNAGTFECRRVVDARGMLAQINGFDIEVEVLGKVLFYTEATAQMDHEVFCFLDCACQTDTFSDAYGIWNYRRNGDATISKFGFSERSPVKLKDTQQISAWFQSDYSRYPYSAAAISLLTGLFCGNAYKLYIKPCAFVATPDKRPAFLMKAEHAVITGCNGMAAKCCQAIAESFVDKWEV